jgi:hypothetical protein
LQEELPRTSENVPLSIRRRVYFKHDEASLHFSRAVKNFFKSIIQSMHQNRGKGFADKRPAIRGGGIERMSHMKT